MHYLYCSLFKPGACGVAESSNIKQCLRTLSSRVHMSCDTSPGLHLDVRDDVSAYCDATMYDLYHINVLVSKGLNIFSVVVVAFF